MLSRTRVVPICVFFDDRDLVARRALVLDKFPDGDRSAYAFGDGEFFAGGYLAERGRGVGYGHKRSVDLLQVAGDVIHRNGVRALTLESVARAAGVSKGDLLYHFPNKCALIEAMAEARVAEVGLAMERHHE